MIIGILGAGQLGRMLALAGYPLDLDFVFLDPATEACAAPLGEHLFADYGDEHALSRVLPPGRNRDLRIRERTGEDRRLRCRARVADAGAGCIDGRPGSSDREVAVRPAEDSGAALHAGRNAGRARSRRALGRLAGSVKTRRLGYDGKGRAVLRSAGRSRHAPGRVWRAAPIKPASLILEAFVPFERELSCLAVRGKQGELAFYPVVANVHRDGILRTAIPQQNDPLQAEAEQYARRVIEHLDYVGVMAFEFFVAASPDGSRLLANEIAPRVHNSGHWTIEGAECSQFENHLRAITGLPLGSTALRGHSAMVNFIGDTPDSNADLAAISGVHIHHYGKNAEAAAQGRSRDGDGELRR